MRRFFSLFLLLSVVFLNFMGLGLVFPLFGALFFDPDVSLLPVETGGVMRGLWMGILIGLSPLVQFFGSPIFGSLSDQRGRKRFIMYGLSIGVVSYIIGVTAMRTHSLGLLALYRALFGVNLCIVPVVQAALVDISTPKNKSKYLSFYSMALAIGFSSGPFVGGMLADLRLGSGWDHSVLFLVGGILTVLNLTLLSFGFKETHRKISLEKTEFFRGFSHIKAAWQNRELRYAFFGFFFFLYGLDFFLQFATIPLRSLFGYTTSQVGSFYAYNSFTYSIATGFLIRPFLRRYEMGRLLAFSMLFAPIVLLCLLLIKDSFYLWFYVPVFAFVAALYHPVAMSYVSDHARSDTQGEMLGIYQSVMALAILLGPIVTGPLVGILPTMPICLGAGLMGVGGFIFTCQRVRKGKAAQSFNEVS